MVALHVWMMITKKKKKKTLERPSICFCFCSVTSTMSNIHGTLSMQTEELEWDWHGTKLFAIIIIITLLQPTYQTDIAETSSPFYTLLSTHRHRPPTRHCHYHRPIVKHLHRHQHRWTQRHCTDISPPSTSLHRHQPTFNLHQQHKQTADSGDHNQVWHGVDVSLQTILACLTVSQGVQRRRQSSRNLLQFG